MAVIRVFQVTGCADPHCLWKTSKTLRESSWSTGRSQPRVSAIAESAWEYARQVLAESCLSEKNASTADRSCGVPPVVGQCRHSAIRITHPLIPKIFNMVHAWILGPKPQLVQRLIRPL